MGQSPFAKRPVSGGAGQNRRRSTRVEFAVPVIFTGRDASGRPFREETETSTVNFHGAKIKTRHQVLIGSQVVIENRQNGVSEKAICVWVGEPSPDQNARDIALQLVKPKNLWGLENPPADWIMEEEAELRGQPATPRTAPAVIKIPPRPVTASSSVADNPRATSSQLSLDSQLTQLQQRSAQLMESTLKSLREQAEKIVREAIEKFEEHLEAAVAGAETRVSRRTEKAFADFSSTLETLRAEAAGWKQQAVESAEEELRSKVMEVFLRAQEAFNPRPPGGNPELKSKK